MTPTIQLSFHRVKDKVPEHESNILYIRKGYDGIRITQGEVSYLWRQLDEQGQFTSTSIEYNPEEDPPSNCLLLVCCDQEELFPDTLWADADALLDAAEADKTFTCPHEYNQLPGYCRFCGTKEILK